MTEETKPLTPALAPTAHHPSGPSNFPMWAECIDYEPPAEDPEDLDAAGEEDTDMSAKARGTAKHHSLAMVLSGDSETKQRAFEGLTDREREEVQFVAGRWLDVVQEHGYSPEDVRVEQRVTLVGSNFEVIYFGTCDGEAGPLDLEAKFGEVRNYFPQLAGYALPKMEGRGESKRIAYVIYGRARRHERHVITKETAQTVVYGLLARRASTHRKATPCQYCGWCAKSATCSAFVSEPVGLVARREDWSLKLPTPHPSQLNDPAWIGAARYVWKRFLEPWGAAVEFQSSMMAAGGLNVLGFRRQPWPGGKTISNARKAFEVFKADIGEEAAWEALGSFGGAVKVYQAELGISEAKAKGMLENKLVAAGALEIGEATFRLTVEKNAEATIRAGLSLDRPAALPSVVDIPEKRSDLKSAQTEVGA